MRERFDGRIDDLAERLPVGSRRGIPPTGATFTGGTSVREVASSGLPTSAADILETFESEVDSLVEHALHELRELPGHWDTAGEVIDGPRQTVTRSVLKFARCVREGRALSPEDEDFYRTLGADGAHRGVPWALLESAFTVVFHQAWKRLTRIEHDTPDPADEEARSELETRVTHVFSLVKATAKAGYEAGIGGWKTPRHLAERRFVTDALAGAVNNEDARVRSLGMRVPGQWRLVVVVGRRPDSDVAGAVDALLGVLSTAVAGSVSDAPEPHAVVLVAERGEPRELDPQTLCTRHDDVVVIVAPPMPLQRVGGTYGRLRGQLDVATHATSTRVKVDLRDLLRCAVLRNGSDRAAEWFVGVVLGPLLGPRDGRWDPLDTLMALCESQGDRAVAGKALDRAARTVRHRLAQIFDRLDIDRSNHHEVADVLLAIQVLRYRRDRLPPYDDPFWCESFA